MLRLIKAKLNYTICGGHDYAPSSAVQIISNIESHSKAKEEADSASEVANGKSCSGSGTIAGSLFHQHYQAVVFQVIFCCPWIHIVTF